MGFSTHHLDTDAYLTVMIREMYLEALIRDENVSIRQLIADFIEEYLTQKQTPLR